MLRVIEPGIQTTIQDAGRWGYQAYGVPVSGAMDLFALYAANKLVGNLLNQAALEIRSPIALQTDSPHLLALTGADTQFQLDGRTMPTSMSVFARASTLIEIKPRQSSGWIYLAIHGGIDVPLILGSKSTFLRGKFGGLAGRALVVGDEIPIGKLTVRELISAAGRETNGLQTRVRRKEIRVVLGPHHNLFSPEAIASFTESEYVITENADRMGYRLKTSSPLAPLVRTELISCGVPLGAIQVPPDGQPIVLMADHQTTGGYPIIATVISTDIPVIAQRTPGQKIKFGMVSVDEAREAWLDAMKVVTGR